MSDHFFEKVNTDYLGSQKFYEVSNLTFKRPIGVVSQSNGDPRKIIDLRLIRVTKGIALNK